MCSNYIVKTMKSRMLAFAKLPEGFRDEEITSHPFPYKPGIVAVQTPHGPDLTTMSYSLVPSWSPEPRVKFTSYNTRIDTVLDKPTWKEPFRKHHVIVPMTEFIESSYWGKPAGHIISFFEKDKKMLYAAGIYNPWHDRKTGEVIDTYSILTDDPPKSVDDAGHDRCPMFLTEEGAREWLTNGDLRASTAANECKKSTPKDEYVYSQKLVEFLRDHRARLKFDYEIVRPLKTGWEKHVPAERRIR